MLRTEMRNPRTTHIDQMDTMDILRCMQAENLAAVQAVERPLPSIAAAVDAITAAFQAGGRLFYIGAGTSGRLGVLDAADCPPTFGVPADKVVGIIAGGDASLRHASESAEDDPLAGAADLRQYALTAHDVVVGISAAGGAGYTDLRGHWAESQLQWAVEQGYLTGTSATTLSPNKTLTRGMAAVILYRYAGSPTAGENSRFSDVPAGAYYAKAVAWVDQAGLMSGRGNGRFAPQANMTREEFLTVLYRLRVQTYGVPEQVGQNNWVTLADYGDQDTVSAYARESLAWAVGDLFLAYSGTANFLRPRDAVTRAEVVTLLSRYDCLVAGNPAQVCVIHPEQIATITFRPGSAAPYDVTDPAAIQAFAERVNGFTYDHMVRTKNTSAPGAYYYVWLKDKTGAVVRRMTLSVNGIDGCEKTVTDGSELFPLSWLQGLLTA